MSEQEYQRARLHPAIHVERVFTRFTLSQRWEHALLMLSVVVLLLTGLPQKYRAEPWSQQLLSTPERVFLFQTVHRVAAVLLILVALYHLGKAIYQIARRRLSADIFISWQDFRDAGQMVAYLLFLRKQKPAFGKYNFEQKVTYWFTFIGVGIMILSGLVLWFPELVTRFLPGRIVPAAKLAHSAEALVLGIFIVIWHIYHVHLERANLSIFTGKINEKDMQTYHTLEYQRLIESPTSEQGGGQP